MKSTGKRVRLLIGAIVLAAAVLAALALTLLGRTSEWKELTSVSGFEGIADGSISEITLRKSVTSAEWAVFSDEDLVQMWTNALNSMEVRRASSSEKTNANSNGGGGMVVEIKTERSDLSFKLRVESNVYKIEIGNVLYDIKEPEKIPFEETYDAAIARHGVKTPWD